LGFVGVGGEAAADDGGEEQAEWVQPAEDAEVGCGREPDLDVENAAADFGPGEGLVDWGGVEADARALLLGVAEEAGGLDGVGEEDGGGDADEESEDAFDDEDPLVLLEM
jgi:hypothetical protein